jgi:ribosome-associated protein
MAYTEKYVTSDALRDLVIDALEDLKGRNIVTLDVADLSDFTDYMVIVSGTSNRHVKALVDQVVESTKAQGSGPRGVEGRETYEWVLVDLGDVLVHVMREETRQFYDLERLWTELPSDTESLS